MENIVLCLILYAVVIVFDITPQIKSRKIKFLWFSVLVYFVTFTIEILLLLNIIDINLNVFIKNILSSIFKNLPPA